MNEQTDCVQEGDNEEAAAPNPFSTNLSMPPTSPMPAPTTKEQPKPAKEKAPRRK